LDPAEGDTLRDAGATPLTFTALLAQAGARYGAEGIKATQDTDRGMKRFTLERTDKTKVETLSPGEMERSHFGLQVPSIVWVDPKTDLVRETNGDKVGRRIFSYGAAPVASIFDAGAPRDAQIFDCRPTAETAVVFDRVMVRIHTPLADGVAAMATVSESKGKPASSQMVVYDLAGHNWTKRTYRVGAADAKAALLLPGDWYAAGTDVFFRKLGVTLPLQTIQSDGVTMRTANIDPSSGQEIRPWRGGGPRNVPGREEETGRAAQVGESGPTRELYPWGITKGRYFMGHTLELLTSADRPGLLALRVREHLENPDMVIAQTDYWIDPQHDDRPVTYVMTAYKDSRTGEVLNRTVTDFSAYATAPAPDSRSYPTLWTRVMQQKDETGKFVESTRETTRFHLFPGKVLPEIPRVPEGLP
jgi:hypothetical protein